MWNLSTPKLMLFFFSSFRWNLSFRGFLRWGIPKSTWGSEKTKSWSNARMIWGTPATCRTPPCWVPKWSDPLRGSFFGEVSPVTLKPVTLKPSKIHRASFASPNPGRSQAGRLGCHGGCWSLATSWDLSGYLTSIYIYSLYMYIFNSTMLYHIMPQTTPKRDTQKWQGVSPNVTDQCLFNPGLIPRKNMMGMTASMGVLVCKWFITPMNTVVYIHIYIYISWLLCTIYAGTPCKSFVKPVSVDVWQ